MPNKVKSKTELLFTSDFQQTVNGDLRKGSEITILFDSERLPFERSANQQGKADWSITAFTQFATDGAVNEVKLAPAKKGKNADTFLKGVVTIPAESREAIIWFMNTGGSGQYYFDSAFGYNYRFPVSETEATPIAEKKVRAKKA